MQDKREIELIMRIFESHHKEYETIKESDIFWEHDLFYKNCFVNALFQRFRLGYQIGKSVYKESDEDNESD